MELAEATWPDIEAADPAAAVIPVGSTEQHGPHAPLGTDSFTATAVAEAGVDAADATVVRTPTIPVGVSAEHRHFPGTLSLTADTLRSVLRDVAESLAAHDIDRIVVVNGHGGNVEALGEVCAQLSRTETAYTVPFTWFDVIDEQVGHAGPLETSVLYHLDPDLVHRDELEAAAADAADRWGEWVRTVNLAHDTIEFTENGVVGDPTQADTATGAEHVATAAEALATVIHAVIDRPWPPE